MSPSRSAKELSTQRRAGRRAWGVAIGVVVVGAMIAGLAMLWTGRAPPPAPQVTPWSEPAAPASLREYEGAVQAQFTAALAQVRAAPAQAAPWMRLGMIYEAYLLLDLARQTYEQALLRDAADPRAWYHLALMRVETGDLDGGIEAMRQVIILDGDYAPAHLRLGLWLLDRGDLDAAERALQRAARIDPAAAPGGAWLGQARVALTRDQPQRAVELLQRSLGSSSANAGYAWQLLAAACRRLGRHADAADAMLRGRDAQAQWIDPWQYEVVQFRLDRAWRRESARALADQGRFDEALSLIDALARDADDDVELLMLRGTTLRQAGRLDEAVAALRAALRRDESSDRAHFNLALALHDQWRGAPRPGAIDEALAHLDRAVALNPRRLDAWSLKGQIMLQQGRFDESITAYRQAAALDAADPVWPFRVGLCQLAAGRWTDAAATFEPITQSAPDFADAWRGLGVAHMKLGALEKARAALHRALALAPGDPRTDAAMRELEQRGVASKP